MPETISRQEAAKRLSVDLDIVDRWIASGILEGRGDSVSCASLEEVADDVQELRRLGKTPGMVDEALRRIEYEEMSSDDRFLESLRQMQRGERGTWPERFDTAAPGSDFGPGD